MLLGGMLELFSFLLYCKRGVVDGGGGDGEVG
jgi:hypothetical protein